MTKNISINHQNIAITLSLIIAGVLAGTNEHLPAIPRFEIPPVVPVTITIIAVAIVAMLVFSLVGTCGAVGRM